MKKYELTNETITIANGKTLYRIRALVDIEVFRVKIGDLGGYIEKEENLSHYGDAWVCGDSMVYGDARVFGNVKIYGDARVYDNAKVFGDAWVGGNAKVFDYAKVCVDAEVYGNSMVFGYAKVYGDANVFGYAEVCGDALIKDMSDYIVFKNWWSSGRYFTWTKSNNKWKVGCFYGSGKELVEKAYKDSELSGREYKRVVDYVEPVLKEIKS